MKSFSIGISKYDYKTVVYDILALAVITLTPAISHITAIPIYLLEPMRIILLLSIVHTSKKNVYLLAVALPLFSFIISAHPTILKSALISTEMILNVFLFFYLVKFFKNSFPAAIVSILISKIYYYLLKFAFISFGLISTELVSTPIILQVVVGTSISVYLWFFFKNERIK
jgi:hypothetical protein